MRILILEDDPELGEHLQGLLKAQNYAVDRVLCKNQAITALKCQTYNLILMEWKLNEQLSDPWLVVRGAKQQQPPIPVLIFSHDNQLNNRVAALDAGADDYLTKTIEESELLARIRVFKRRNKEMASNIVYFNGLEMDTLCREVKYKDEYLNFSVREFSVLELLLCRASKIVSKRQIVDSLSAWDAEFSENAVEVYIHRLRRHLEKLPVYIETIRGVGYSLKRKAL